MLNYIVRAATDWLFRRRSLGYALVRLGFVLLSALLVGLTVGLRIPTENGPLVFDWSTSGGTSEAISWAIAIVAIGLVGSGLRLIRLESLRQERAKVVVIEARGLRDWHGEALAESIPSHITGRRDALVLNFRQGLIDGEIVDPSVPLNRLASLPHDIATRTDGLDRKDISFVVGGLAPVPLLFLLGLLVDDEGATQFMDWDRHARMWRVLDAADDGNRFIISGVDEVEQGTNRIALCISASYDVLDADVATVEPAVPIIRMDLDGRGTDAHWSEDKQRALGLQFLDLAILLAARGVKEIALFVAAPASLALRLGALYDKRNLPSLQVNQYERANSIVYPWAVDMPVCGKAKPTLITREGPPAQTG